MQVPLTRRGTERWRGGHPWIFRSDLAIDPGQEGAGEAVRVVDQRGWFLGKAWYSSSSQIALRQLGLDDVAIDEAFLASRIAAADAGRRTLYPDVTCYRVVHGEADFLPGLVVDRYGDWLSVQLGIQATDALRETLTRVLAAHFTPKGIVERSDARARSMEGLEALKGALLGEIPPTVEISEGSITLDVDLLEGQKTGTFLDQRDNHLRAGQLARGEALDCFSYLGGFALQMARGCDRVTAVEISDAACARLSANAKRNGLDNVEVVEANAFDYLRDVLEEGRSFDTVVLDPPSFAKNKASIEAGLRGYKEINLRALQLLRPGGHLITASCSHHVDEQMFGEMLAAAAADARRPVQLIERRGAGADHPERLGMRESRYLKCWVLRA